MQQTFPGDNKIILSTFGMNPLALKVPMIAPLIVALSSLHGAPRMEDVLEFLRASRIPDTADYVMESRTESGGNVMVSSAHMIQLGEDRQRTDLVVAGMKLRIVKSKGYQETTNLSNGQREVVPVSKAPSARPWESDVTGTWSPATSLGSGLWLFRELPAGDSSQSLRRFRWNESLREVVALEILTPGSDTTTMNFEWVSIGGRKVPKDIRLLVKSDDISAQTRLTFTNWSFPKSLPADLFQIRGK